MANQQYGWMCKLPEIDSVTGATLPSIAGQWITQILFSQATWGIMQLQATPWDNPSHCNRLAAYSTP
jgi:hypothetical protein